MPEKPHNFWQEVKRRKVFRVIAMYAAAAYVIIELSNNIVEPLNLPDWTPTLIIVLLIIGFPFAVIFSWIFDVTPKGIQKTKSAKVAREKEEVSKPAKRKLKVSDIIIAVLLVAVIILVYPKIFKHDKLEQLRSKGEISIAVMPFRNMTNDTIWDVWQDGIKDNLITYLSNYSENLTVKQPESVNGVLQSSGLTNYASITPSAAGSISRKLDANIFISGSISQAGTTVRVNAQLVDSKTEEAFKSFQIEGTSEREIFHIIDSLSGLIKDFLIMSVMQKDIITDFRWLISTGSAEAYRCYMYANQAFYKCDWATAKDWYLKAVEIYTNFTEALRMLTYSYMHLDMWSESENTCLKLYRKKDQMSIQEKIWADAVYSDYFETPYERIKHLGLLIELDDQMPVPYSMMAGGYELLNQYENAIPLREKELKIYDEWGSRPRWSSSYTSLGRLYHLTGQFNKEKRLYRKAEKDFPDDYILLYRQAVLALTVGDTVEANKYIEKYIVTFKINVSSEASLATNLAGIYSEAGIQDKAEEYYSESLSMEPGSPEAINNLSWFLIDTERNVSEGIKLIDKALELRPDRYDYLHTRGWGLYKQGKIEEALETLQKSWDAMPWNYDHDIYLHIEEVKKAVSNQKGEQ